MENLLDFAFLHIYIHAFLYNNKENMNSKRRILWHASDAKLQFSFHQFDSYEFRDHVNITNINKLKLLNRIVTVHNIYVKKLNIKKKKQTKIVHQIVDRWRMRILNGNYILKTDIVIRR